MGTLGEQSKAIPRPLRTMERLLQKVHFRRYFSGEVLLDISPSHQDGWKNNLGVLPAMEPGGHPLDGWFWFQAPLETECLNTPKHCFSEVVHFGLL